ncbi:class I mannose-6-phosphate isomerase [Poriferisphaera sp. WC338]|uniref:class I mannose-6-phosphate isomerase n=1 Tax=Poriferisphaera sp. WC338 TaxID=3425129 RepID=UPI003D818F80
MTMQCNSTVVEPPFTSNYDKRPVVPVPINGRNITCIQGWNDIAVTINDAWITSNHPTFAIDCYLGVDTQELKKYLVSKLKPNYIIEMIDLFKPQDEIEKLVAPWLGSDDPIFGFLCPLQLEQFFCPQKLAKAKAQVKTAKPNERILILGIGATLIQNQGLLIYADMPRWEGQLRQRRNQASNLGVNNHNLKASLQYKRAYFIDWRVCDRHKKPLLKTADYFLDTTHHTSPKLANANHIHEGLQAATHQPFRVVPFFDPGPWGGQWMRQVCDLKGYNDPEPQNYAWCFDCVPEENSLLLGFNDCAFELPSVNALYNHPRELLGDLVHARFGDEFPIRFDFLDTMDGGNLSFQVHPLTEYIQQHFGMHYTQDESYYLLDAADDGTCYLGLKPGVDPDAFQAALEDAQAGGKPFDADRFANCFPAKAHDHFLIPAGTVHCSGKNTMVLEISATPYIFTFKLWDWGRLGLDGNPRPINIKRGMQNIQWDRDTTFCETQLINTIEPVGEGDGWREERTGLHQREFIETRRHWFTKTVPHHTGGIEHGSVNVLNLVQGREAIVESPTDAFEPFIVHYAETFIVPASVDAYTIRPYGEAEGTECATVKAFVRTQS